MTDTAKSTKGFTLIELLIVIAIIGKRIEYTVDDFGVLETLTPIAGGANEVH